MKNQIEKENALTNIRLPNFEDSFDTKMNLYLLSYGRWNREKDS